jgi:S-DNA-T family DNA segregation ATPase FtsK/SpoIIIE
MMTNDWMMRAPAKSGRRPRAEPRVVPASTRPKPGARVEREQQGSFIRPEGFQLPSMHLLAEPKNVVRDSTLSADALEQNARMLEGVLEDFGVKGEIIHVRPGPSSRSTNWSRHPASSRRASSALPTISPAR